MSRGEPAGARLILALAALALVGCSGSASPAAVAATTWQAHRFKAGDLPTSPDQQPPPLPAPQPGPLPGQQLPLSAPLLYPLLIQIENTSDARPQTGIGAADVIFQYLTEGGITRLSALFHRAPGVVGPVRSARFVSVYLAQRFRLALMASGGSGFTYDKIKNSGIIATINDFDPTHFFRWGGRVAPHNLYTPQDQMIRMATLPRDAHPSDFPRANGSWGPLPAAPSFTVPDDRVTFVYTGAGDYQVISDGEEESETTYGPLRPRGVAVLHVPQGPIPGTVEDVEGAAVRDYNLHGGGAAELYANGVMLPGRWNTPSDPDGPIELSDTAGQPVRMPLGQLWVVLAP